MRVTVLNEVIILQNIEDAFGQIQVHINKILSAQEMYFSHMIIDGVEVYSDYNLYIEDHLTSIDEIIIKAKTMSEFVKDIIVSIHNYSVRALPELKLLADTFYHSSNSDSWIRLNDLIEAIQWIHDAMISIDKEKGRPANWDKFITIASSFELISNDFLNAIEAKDNILIADIITYEILPLFQSIQQMKLEEYALDDKGLIENAEGKH